MVLRKDNTVAVIVAEILLGFWRQYNGASNLEQCEIRANSRIVVMCAEKTVERRKFSLQGWCIVFDRTWTHFAWLRGMIVRSCSFSSWCKNRIEVQVAEIMSLRSLHNRFSK